MLEFYDVDLEDELLQILKPTSEINHSMLNKIGLKKANGTWTCKVEGIDEVGPSGFADQEGAVVAPVDSALVPYVPPVQHGEPLSQFKQMLLWRLDNISGNQRMHHEYCATCFQLLH